eukprot:Hpha_TRINITY_DN16183_c1_g4::TRINITY_DN16183_c1_g4_i1::g.9001::m.9001
MARTGGEDSFRLPPIGDGRATGAAAAPQRQGSLVPQKPRGPPQGRAPRNSSRAGIGTPQEGSRLERQDSRTSRGSGRGKQQAGLRVRASGATEAAGKVVEAIRSTRSHGTGDASTESKALRRARQERLEIEKQRLREAWASLSQHMSRMRVALKRRMVETHTESAPTTGTRWPAAGDSESDSDSGAAEERVVVARVGAAICIQAWARGNFVRSELRGQRTGAISAHWLKRRVQAGGLPLKSWKLCDTFVTDPYVIVGNSGCSFFPDQQAGDQHNGLVAWAEVLPTAYAEALPAAVHEFYPQDINCSHCKMRHSSRAAPHLPHQCCLFQGLNEVLRRVAVSFARAAPLALWLPHDCLGTPSPTPMGEGQGEARYYPSRVRGADTEVEEEWGRRGLLSQER